MNILLEHTILRSTAWGKLCDVSEALLPYDIDLNVLFHQDNSVGNSKYGSWN